MIKLVNILDAALVVILSVFVCWAGAQNNGPVPGPTLPPPVSNVLFTGYQGILQAPATLTIPASGTTSNALYLKGFELSGILLPATFTGTAVSFLASYDGTNFYPLKTTTAGTTLSYTVTQNTFAAIAPADFAGVLYLKIVSNATEAAARTLKLSIRGI